MGRKEDDDFKKEIKLLCDKFYGKEVLKLREESERKQEELSELKEIKRKRDAEFSRQGELRGQVEKYEKLLKMFLSGEVKILDQFHENDCEFDEFGNGRGYEVFGYKIQREGKEELYEIWGNSF